MSHQGKLSREYPPLAVKGQIATLHFFQTDVLASGNLAGVFIETASQGSAAFGHFLGSFADVNQPIFEIERVDTTERRADAFG
jgi:hypothetical protein